MFSDHTSLKTMLARKLSGAAGRLWASLEYSIPLGYQNKTGFHYDIEFIASLLEPFSERQAEPWPS
jgi:hypothetical protein